MGRIIGISGKAQQGKDALAAVLQRRGFVRAAFADALKNAASEVFGFDADQLYGATKETVDQYWSITPRQALQRLGVGVREIFGQDVWVRALMRGLSAGPDWVIPDVRFPNEAQAIQKAGGYMVRIVRPGHVGLTGAAAEHISETALDDWDGFDARVYNDSDIVGLDGKADELLRELEIHA